MHHAPLLAAYLDNLWNRLHGGINGWTLFGLLANAIFSSRFFVQWYVSERRGQSVIPVSFWYLSLIGSVVLTIYAIHLGAVPIILGTLPPTFIYTRNLVLIARSKKRLNARAAADSAVPDDPHAQPRPLAHPVIPRSPEESVVAADREAA